MKKEKSKAKRGSTGLKAPAIEGAKIIDELLHQRREIIDGQRDLLHHVRRLEVYVASLSHQLSRTLEALAHAQRPQGLARNALFDA